MRHYDTLTWPQNEELNFKKFPWQNVPGPPIEGNIFSGPYLELLLYNPVSAPGRAGVNLKEFSNITSSGNTFKHYFNWSNFHVSTPFII